MGKNTISQKKIDEQITTKVLPNIGKKIKIEFKGPGGRRGVEQGILTSLSRYRDDVPGTYTDINLGRGTYPLGCVKKISRDGKIIYSNPHVQFHKEESSFATNRIQEIYKDLDERTRKI